MATRVGRLLCASLLFFFAFPCAAAEIPPGLDRLACAPMAAGAPAPAMGLDRVETAEISRTDLGQQGGRLGEPEIGFLVVLLAIVLVLIVS